MAVLNLDYYTGKDLYSDGEEIENELLAMVQSGKKVEELQDVSFPVLYHLSRIRENILNWYPFDPQGVGLEIGSGCGAITGLLCDRLKRVVSVELSGKRAKINHTRHEDLNNLEIYVGNLNDMHFDCLFDYIILNGVFEYAMSFTPGDDPYELFLENVKRFLKPDGIILIAIENRLGIKYFAGAPEDHTDKYFDGLDGYEGNHTVRTFSKAEWEIMLEECGLFYHRFYYPYPDYKFPREIFTDASLADQTYGSRAWSFTHGRMQLFNEKKVAEALQQEEIMDRFVNSFLIEMSRVPLQTESEVVYAKLGTDRADDYAIATVIEQRGRHRAVVKKPMTQKAQAHIVNMHSYIEACHAEDNPTQVIWKPVTGVLEHWMQKTQICYPYLNTRSLGVQAEKALKIKDLDTVISLVNQVRELCINNNDCIVSGAKMKPEQKAEFANVFGPDKIADDELCVAPANIDLILDNIFHEDGEYQVIDCEWMFEFPIPVDFIVWRSANELYSNHPQLEQLCEKSEFFARVGIEEKSIWKYWRWATTFAEKYVGANKLLNYSVPMTNVSLEEIRQREEKVGNLNAALYIDTGNGFSEDRKIDAEVKLVDGHFSVEFDLSKYQGVKALRFDPLEGSCCRCKIDKNATSVKLVPFNAAARIDHEDLFLTTDPNYMIRNVGWAGHVKVQGQLTIMSMEEALQTANQLLQKGIGNRWKKIF